MTIRMRFQLIFGVLLAAMVVACIASFQAIRTSDRLSEVEDRRFNSFRLADELRQSSDDLTRMARSFAATRDGRFKTHFQDILDIRSGVIPYPPGYEGIFWDFVVAEDRRLSYDGSSSSLQDRMRAMGFSDTEFEKLSVAEQNSNDLVRLEDEAMNAVVGQFRDKDGGFTELGTPDQRLALKLLFGAEYHRAKAKIMHPIQEFMELLETRTRGESELIRRQHNQSLITTVIAVLLTFALGAWGFHYLRTSVVAPMIDLREAIDTFRVSRTAVEVPHTARTDEVGAIAKGFQATAHEIATYIDEINAAREELDQGQAELREREERIRSLLELSPIGFALTRLDGERLFRNDAIGSILGYDADGDVPNDASEIYKNPEDRERFIETIDRDGEVSGFETEWVRRDGTTAWVLLNSRLIDYQGAPAIMTWADDITARKQAEQAQARSEQRLRALIDNSPAEIVLKDENLHYIQVNRVFEEHYGITRDEVRGKTAKMFLPDSMIEPINEQDRAVMSTGVATEIELETIVNGEKRINLESKFPIHDDAGNAIGIAGIATDITERKNIERTIRESESKIRELLDTGPIGVTVVDDETGKRLFVNQRLLRMLGAESPDELNAQAIADSFVDPEDQQRIYQIVGEGGSVENVEVERRRLDGSTFWSLISQSTIQDFQGRDARVVWVVDIDDQKRAEAEVAENERRLTSILESSPAGISITSHDAARRLYANPRFNEMLTGDADQSVKDLSIADSYVDAENLENVRQILADRGFHFDAEYQRRRTDGTTWWCHHSWRPVEIWGEDAFICWHLDITDIKDAEARVREILEQSPVGVSIIEHSSGERLYANPRFNEMFTGDPKTSMTGQNVADTFVDLDELEEIRQITNENGFFHDAELLRKSLDGTEWWCLQNWRPLPSWGDGVHMVWHYDITERKNAETEIARQKNVLDSTLQNMDQGIVMLDGDLRFLAYNQKVSEMMGIPADIFDKFDTFEAGIRHIVKDIWKLEDWQAHVDRSMETVRSRDYQRYDAPMGGKIVEVRQTPLDDGGIVRTFTDITERKEAEVQLEDAFNVISSSIKYASRIQRSVLPDQDMLAAVVKDHFILWEPRDVVGGDMYWVGAWGNGCLILLGDCTGHGVPGAFMTLISIGALERAMTEFEGGDVGRLISRMHQYIQVTLSQHYAGGDSDDGIELGACYFEPDQQKMTFVGARFDLFIAEGNDVSSVRGIKKGLGYRGIPYTQEYEEHSVELKPGLNFYMTTDGLTDQVGHEVRRMFGKKRLKGLLSEVRDQSMRRQKQAIYAALEDYQGSEVRRDDVSMIGFKVR